MWYGGPFVFHTCPVRELDTEADFYLEWLAATHTLTEHGWVLTQLPAPGGVGAQDARLMQGLAFARDEANAFLHEQRLEHQRDRQTAEYFERIERESHA